MAPSALSERRVRARADEEEYEEEDEFSSSGSEQGEEDGSPEGSDGGDVGDMVLVRSENLYRNYTDIWSYT